MWEHGHVWTEISLMQKQNLVWRNTSVNIVKIHTLALTDHVTILDTVDSCSRTAAVFIKTALSSSQGSYSQSPHNEHPFDKLYNKARWKSDDF